MNRESIFALVKQLFEEGRPFDENQPKPFLVLRNETVKIVEKLTEFFLTSLLPSAEARVLNKLVDDLQILVHRMESLCHLALCANPQNCSSSCPDFQKSKQITHDFIQSFPAIQKQVQLDLIAAYRGDPAAKSYAEIILAYPGFWAVLVYRLAHQLHINDVPFIPRIMTEYVHSKTGIDIHPGAKIGKGFFIDHGTGVVIGETCVIGDDVKIYQGVTLGALSFPRDEKGQLIKGIKRHPTIEEDVTIYAGATILGGETVIGKGSIIGGNVWLTKSVPPYSKVTNRPKLELREFVPDLGESS